MPEFQYGSSSGRGGLKRFVGEALVMWLTVFGSDYAWIGSINI
jgi:hypothetical protein